MRPFNHLIYTPHDHSHGRGHWVTAIFHLGIRRFPHSGPSLHKPFQGQSNGAQWHRQLLPWGQGGEHGEGGEEGGTAATICQGSSVPGLRKARMSMTDPRGPVTCLCLQVRNAGAGETEHLTQDHTSVSPVSLFFFFLLRYDSCTIKLTL